MYSVSLLEGLGGRAGAWPRVSRGSRESDAHQSHLDPKGKSFIKDIKDETMN